MLNVSESGRIELKSKPIWLAYFNSGELELCPYGPGYQTFKEAEI